MGSVKIIGHFVLHVLLGSILFLVLAGAAVVLKISLDWLVERGLPTELFRVAHYVELIVFGIDIVCFLFFVIVEAIVLCREIANEAKRSREVTI